jgi:tRNA pseudouridine38-40 synthase
VRYFIKLSFDGTPYCGWQIQQNAHSVQAEIEAALEKMLSEAVQLTGCGRTDTGVHALQFYAHFETEKELDGYTHSHKLNSLLPQNIAILSLFPVEENTHARFSAHSRSYAYYMHFDRNPFLQNKSYYYYGTMPDIALLNASCHIIRNTTNFKAFSKSRTQVANFECTIKEAFWQYEGKQLVFRVKANRFLRNMVRAMVGTMLEVGTGKIALDQLQEVLKSGNRQNAGTSVPACGLYLVKIDYPENLNIL